MYQQYRTAPTHGSLPTMYDLPSEDPEDMGLPDEFHGAQPDLLKETCQIQGQEFFVAADLNLYYDAEHLKWYKRPDWFLVLGVAAGTSQAEARLSYVMWQEQVPPFLVVELLSPGTEAEDLGQTLQVVGKPPTKWQVYEQILQVPYCAVFDRYSSRFRMFILESGQYREVPVAGQGFWFEEIALGLGVWVGRYQGFSGQWLRWYDRTGNWILACQERAEQAEERVAQAEERAERLAAKLRKLGIAED